MKKELIKLTESDLHKIIKESVNRILMESSKFDEYLEKELTMPYEARKSQMTDEEIIGMLQQHKQEQMDYDAQQEKRREQQKHLSRDLENKNIRDNDSKFSPRASYLRGDFDNVPL